MLHKTQSGGDRYYTIDMLKGIAIIMIIITHYLWSDTERMNPIFPFAIDMAVPIMMFCTGFLWSIHGSEHDLFSLVRLRQKLLRILLPFAVCFIPDCYYAFKTGEAYDLGSAVRLFLVGGRGPGSYYVPVMIQLIILIPLIIMIVREYRYKGILIVLGINLLFELCKNVFSVSENAYRLLAFRYLFIVACGCYAYLHNRDGSNASDRIWLVIYALLGTVFIVATVYMGYLPHILNLWTGTSCIACMFIVPVIYPVIRSGFRLPVFEYIGRSSWGVFLVQKLYYKNLSPLIYDHIGSRALQILVSMAICLTIGVLFDRIMYQLMHVVTRSGKR